MFLDSHSLTQRVPIDNSVHYVQSVQRTHTLIRTNFSLVEHFIAHRRADFEMQEYVIHRQVVESRIFRSHVARPQRDKLTLANTTTERVIVKMEVDTRRAYYYIYIYILQVPRRAQ